MKIIIIGFIIFNIINIPLYKFIFKKFFPTNDEFTEAVHYSLMPDLFSLFKGQYLKDVTSEFQLKFFLAVCAIILVGEISFLVAAVDWFLA